jgi:hypothetical protein
MPRVLEEDMAKKLGVIRRSVLNMKLRSPKGVKLSNNETSAVINIWKEDAKKLEKNNSTLESAAKQISSNLILLPDALEETTKARSDAARFFKITKDPLKKREWARRLVVAERARTSIKGAQKRMEGMSERIKTLVADATLEKRALDIRVGEAEAYQKMGDGLHLVGESLINARSRAKTMEIEFSNLELGIETLEKSVKGSSDEELLLEAERIAGGNNGTPS